MSVQDVVAAGPLLLAVPVALAAGVVSFASPCMLPLVPGYLSYLAGLSGSALDGSGTAAAASPAPKAAAARDRSGVRGTFQAGSGASVLVLEHPSDNVPVTVPAGRRRPRRPRADRRVPLGAALFAVSWTPCIGPTLAAVQALALTSASRGAVLSAAYSLGLGSPFVAVAFGVRRGMAALQLVRRHTRSVMVAGGALLVVTGLLELTGEWNSLIIDLRLLLPASSTSPL